MFKNHLWVSTCDNCLSVSGLPHSKWCFLAPSIFLQNSRCRYFFCCVNVSHFPYPFFGWRAFRLFPVSGSDKQCCYEHNCAHVFVAWLSILWIYTQKNGITGSWGRLFPNFLRNFQVHSLTKPVYLDCMHVWGTYHVDWKHLVSKIFKDSMLLIQ